MDSDAAICYTVRMGHNKPAITDERIDEIRRLIAENPGMTRTVLSKKLCELWDWKSPVGQLKDISARDLLRQLDRKGLIDLPAARFVTRKPGIGADRIKPIKHDAAPICSKVKDIQPISIKIAATRSEFALFKSYIHEYHYLGFDRAIGESIRYFVYGNNGAVLSCLMFGSAAWSCRARDEYIGWDKGQRTAGLTFVTNNSRFLIMPWVRVDHLASYILGQIARRVSKDWEAKYGHPVHLLETFIETPRFRGVCYRAANWRHIGYTSGLGRNSTPTSPALPIKEILVYPMCSDFKEKLCTARLI